MRFWMASPVMFAAMLLMAFGTIPPATAQEPVEENFLTADGVRLKGLFHKASKPAPGNPVVVLLYQPGVGKTLNKPGDWAGLTKTLNAKGFSVFRFDWRGHGKSTDISDPELFWTNAVTGRWNQRYIKGAPVRGRKGIKNDLNFKTDLRDARDPSDSRYFPVFVQDLAAVRCHLDGKNDQNDVNTSSIYVIGAGDTATLGMLWIASEWARPAIHPLLPFGQTYKVVPMQDVIVDPEAGRDIAGAVWLSASRPPAFRDSVVADWARRTLKLRDNNPMLFLYGAKDSKGKRDASFFFDQVLVAKGNRSLGVNPLEKTFMADIKSTNLKGVALLGNDAMLNTETTIMKYLEAQQKDRASVVRRQRKFPGPYFIYLPTFNVPSP